MTGFLSFGLIFSIMYTLHPGRHWVTAQPSPPLYQPDKELSVGVGHSATLCCCIYDNAVKTIAWFKQPNRKKPQIIVTVNREEKFQSGSKMSSFKIERSSNCFNLTILIVMHSDVAMYYCALMEPNNLVFADGTYVKLEDEQVTTASVTTASETSKLTQLDHSVVGEATLPGNNININCQEITVLGLGAALGLCVLLIFCLFYFILRRRKCDKINASIESSPEMKQEAEPKTIYYASLNFTKQTPRVERRNSGSSDRIVHFDVKNTRLNINDS